MDCAPAPDKPGLQAVPYFAFATINQFYFDGNKRTGRWMMNGRPMMHGLDPVGVPVTRQLDLNNRLLHLFVERDATPLPRILAECQFERICRQQVDPAWLNPGRARRATCCRRNPRWDRIGGGRLLGSPV